MVLWARIVREHMTNLSTAATAPLRICLVRHLFVAAVDAFCRCLGVLALQATVLVLDTRGNFFFQALLSHGIQRRIARGHKRLRDDALLFDFLSLLYVCIDDGRITHNVLVPNE